MNLKQPLNFRPVDPVAKIFRSGQPEFAEEWAFIESLGVVQVLKLNTEPENLIPYSMSLFNVPIPWWQQIITEPDYGDIMDALQWLDVPTLIHCEHGINRTGLICALYRIKYQGWKIEDARNEWHNYGAIPIEQEGLEKAFADLAPKL